MIQYSGDVMHRKALVMTVIIVLLFILSRNESGSTNDMAAEPELSTIISGNTGNALSGFPAIAVQAALTESHHPPETLSAGLKKPVIWRFTNRP